MAWKYITKEPTPCKQCAWYTNGKCTIPEEIYEYECPNYNDPDPVYIPEEVDY